MAAGRLVDRAIVASEMVPETTWDWHSTYPSPCNSTTPVYVNMPVPCVVFEGQEEDEKQTLQLETFLREARSVLTYNLLSGLCTCWSYMSFETTKTGLLIMSHNMSLFKDYPDDAKETWG